MLTSLLSYNPIGKTLLAIEHSERDNAMVILGLQVLQKKDEIDISQLGIVNNIKQVSDIIKTSKKVSLTVTDTHILTKEVDHIGTDNEVLSEAFPNLNLNDFYYQILKTTTRSFIAICRKHYIDTLIREYQKEHIQITEIALGNLKITALSPYSNDTELLSYTATIKTSTKEVFSIQPKQEELLENYQIENITIPSTHTLPLASILYSFSDQATITGNVEEKNEQLQQKFSESQFFKKTLQYSIGFLLISLLINFFVFNSTYKNWQGLQEELQVYTTQKESIKKQQSIVNTKEAIVNSIITTGFSKSSYYIDQIIQLQPTTVILKSYTYQPIAKTIRNDKPIQLREHIISITGNATDKADFTAWLQALENLKFIDNVTIVSYGVDKKNTSSFEIVLNTIADDTTK